MPTFDTEHPHAWEFAQQFFHIGLMPNVPADLVKTIISSEANKPYMYDRITKVPLSKIVFDFDPNNPEHKRWATLSWAVGCWGPPPAFCDVDDELYITLAVGEVQEELARLRIQYNMPHKMATSDESGLGPEKIIPPGNAVGGEVVDCARSKPSHGRQKKTASDNTAERRGPQGEGRGSKPAWHNDLRANIHTSPRKAAVVEGGESSGSTQTGTPPNAPANLRQNQSGSRGLPERFTGDGRSDKITPLLKPAADVGNTSSSGPRPLREKQKKSLAQRIAERTREQSGSRGAAAKSSMHPTLSKIASPEKDTTAVTAASVDLDSDEELHVRPAKRRKLHRGLRHSDSTEEMDRDASPDDNAPPKGAAVVAGATSSSQMIDQTRVFKSLADRIKKRKRKHIEKPEATTKPDHNVHADETGPRKEVATKRKRKRVENPEETTTSSNNQRPNEITQETDSDDGDDTPLVVQSTHGNPAIAAPPKRIETPATKTKSPPKATRNGTEADPRQVRADESIGLVNGRELLPSDLVHLQDLFKHSKDVGYSKKELLTAVFESWDTSTPLGERPAAPRIFQITSDMNRVLAGVFRRDCPVALAAGQPRLTRAAFEEATKARKKGEPVFYYGASAHGLPVWDYKDSNGMPVDKSDVLEKTGAVEVATTEIKENWRTWAEPRVKQHDFDVLVWMVRQRLSLWYCENGITFGDGVPLYNAVELSKFERWDLESWSRAW